MYVPTNIDDLTELASDVQEAILSLTIQRVRSIVRIEQYLQRACKTRFAFPENWCDFASVVLAAHLARELNDGVPIQMVRADLGEFALGRHLWVRHARVDVDITCGQFPDAPRPNIVETESMWHRRRFVTPIVYEVCRRPLQEPRFELLATMLDVSVNDALLRQGKCR